MPVTSPGGGTDPAHTGAGEKAERDLAGLPEDPAWSLSHVHLEAHWAPFLPESSQSLRAETDPLGVLMLKQVVLVSHQFGVIFLFGKGSGVCAARRRKAPCLVEINGTEVTVPLGL